MPKHNWGVALMEKPITIKQAGLFLSMVTDWLLVLLVMMLVVQMQVMYAFMNGMAFFGCNWAVISMGRLIMVIQAILFL